MVTGHWILGSVIGFTILVALVALCAVLVLPSELTLRAER